MSATGLLIWGVVVHLVCDWLLQNEWMALNKVSLRHPAAYVHSGIHGLAMLLVFPWWGALAIGVSHLLIDTRKPVVWWSRLIRQTQPQGERVVTWDSPHPIPAYDIGTETRFWVDQVFHIAVVAAMALAVAA